MVSNHFLAEYSTAVAVRFDQRLPLIECTRGLMRLLHLFHKSLRLIKTLNTRKMFRGRVIERESVNRLIRLLIGVCVARAVGRNPSAYTIATLLRTRPAPRLPLLILKKRNRKLCLHWVTVRLSSPMNVC